MDITKSVVYAYSCTCAVHGRSIPAVAASSLGYMLWTLYLVLWFHSLVVGPCLGFLVPPASRPLGSTSVSVFVGLSIYTLLRPCWLMDHSFLISSSPKSRTIPAFASTRFNPIDSAGWSPVSYMVGLLMSGYVCVSIRWRTCIEVCERPKSHMKEELSLLEIGTDHEHSALVLAKGCAPVEPGA